MTNAQISPLALREALAAAALEGKISCEAARALADKLGISYALLGEVANELGIKIKACQLGCFK